MEIKATVISKIQNHLNRYGSITSGKIAEFGALNPYGIIDKLKRKGYVFATEKLKKRNITKYTWENRGSWQ